MNLLCILIGVLAAIISTSLLTLLNWASEFRSHHIQIVFFLPLAGLIIGLLYYYFGKKASRGQNLIIDEIHTDESQIPKSMAPLVFISTVITHLFGGSTGRESTAVQTIAAITSRLAPIFKINKEQKKILLKAAISAGFGSAVGAPLAGIIFGMEVKQIGKLKLDSWLQCTIATLVAYYTSLYLNIPHTLYPKITIPRIDFQLIVMTILLGLAFGLTARLFVLLVHLIEKMTRAYISKDYLIPFIMGFVIIALSFTEGSHRFLGLGTESILNSFKFHSSFQESLMKILMSSLSVASGFKGGEFVPLVFIGTTLGSSLTLMLPLSPAFASALGFGAVFAGAANVPLTCAIMSAELLGYGLLPFSLITCYLSYLFSGEKGIYHSQKIIRSKHHLFQRFLKNQRK